MVLLRLFSFGTEILWNIGKKQTFPPPFSSSWNHCKEKSTLTFCILTAFDLNYSAVFVHLIESRRRLGLMFARGMMDVFTTSSRQLDRPHAGCSFHWSTNLCPNGEPTLPNSDTPVLRIQLHDLEYCPNIWHHTPAVRQFQNASPSSGVGWFPFEEKSISSSQSLSVGSKMWSTSDERWNWMKSWQSFLLLILIRSKLTQQWRWISAEEHSSPWRSTHRTNPKCRARHRRMSNIWRSELINEELKRWKENLFVNEENRTLCQRLFNQLNVNLMERSLKLQLTFYRGQCLSIIDRDNPMEWESMKMAKGEISSLHLLSICKGFPSLQLSRKEEPFNHLNRDRFSSIKCDLLHSMMNSFVPIHPDEMFGKILSPRNSLVNWIFLWIFLVRMNNFALTQTFRLISLVQSIIFFS